MAAHNRAILLKAEEKTPYFLMGHVLLFLKGKDLMRRQISLIGSSKMLPQDSG